MKVEWKKLVAVSDVLYGYPFESSLFSEDYTYMPLIRIRDVKPAKASTYYSGEFNETYRVKKGDILVGMDGEFNLGKWDDRDGLLNQRVLKLKGKEGYCIDGYLFHYMGPVFKKIEKETAGGSVKHLSAKVINSILIPIPSLSDQQRIVEQLDTFTASIENLKEQIAQRRKQYEHYRDQLLDLEGKEGVEVKKLEDIVSKECSLSYGIVQPGDDVVEGVPVVRPVDLTTTFVIRQGLKNTTKEISNSYKRTILNGNEILFCVRGTTGIMSLATQELDGCNVTRGIVPISFDNEITKMFVYYQLKSRKLQKVITDKTNGTALKQINIKDLRQVKLFIPPLSEQQRIVSILDTFEASIQNLEAQLEQRQKQYEYYRNNLLSFN